MDKNPTRSAADPGRGSPSDKQAPAQSEATGESAVPSDRVVTANVHGDRARRLREQTEATLAELVGARVANDSEPVTAPLPRLAKTRVPLDGLARPERVEAARGSTPQGKPADARINVVDGAEVYSLSAGPTQPTSQAANGRARSSAIKRSAWWAGSLFGAGAVAVGVLVARLPGRLPEEITAHPLEGVVVVQKDAPDTLIAPGKTELLVLHAPQELIGAPPGVALAPKAPPTGTTPETPRAPEQVPGAAGTGEAPGDLTKIELSPADVAKSEAATETTETEPAKTEDEPSEAATGAAAVEVPGEALDAATMVRHAQTLLRGDRRESTARSAKSLLVQSIAQQSDNPHAHAALAEACLRLREASCALAAIKRAVHLRPKRGIYTALEAKIEAAFAQ